MARLQINYLDRKDRIIGFYILCGEYTSDRRHRWKQLLEDASLDEPDTSNYPGAPAGWARFEIVPDEPFPKAYVICNKCHGVATAIYNVDEYFAIDCPACGRHLQNIIETESPGEPAPKPDARAGGGEISG